MGNDLRDKIVKLYSLGIEVFTEEQRNKEVISEAYQSSNPVSVLKSLGEVEGYLAERTIERLASLPSIICEKIASLSVDTYCKKFPIGGMEASNLRAAQNYHDFLSVLLMGHPKSQDIVSRGLIFNPLSKKIVKELDNVGIIGIGFGGDVTLGCEDKEISNALQIVRGDFEKIGEEISYGRLTFLAPYLSQILDKDEQKRWVILESIVNRKYPYIDSNKMDWESHIRLA